MSVDVLIKQGLFGKKTMPLEVILGDHLHYGNFDQDHLNVDELGETEFIAYDPRSIGRGFSVVWNPKEKKRIALRLLHPSTPQELHEFYAAVERMVKYWNGKLVVDGNRVSLTDFMAGLPGMLEFNHKIIKQFSQQILSGEHETLTFYSAMWPLELGKEEAAEFLKNPDAYAAWLHERQSMNVCYGSPRFYAGEQGIFAQFTILPRCQTLLPYKPTVPLGMMDPTTGRVPECNTWLIRLAAQDEETAPQMLYSDFLNALPADKKVRYDGGHFLLEMPQEELEQIFGLNA